MKRSSSPVAGLIAVFLLLSTVHTAEGQVFGTDTLRVRGSRGVASRINLYADDFMKANPDKRVVVVGGETQKGIDFFLDGNAEVLMTSRRLTEEEQKRAKEKGMALVERQVGVGSVAFVSNPANPVKDLTVEQASKILSGEFTNWKQVGGKDAPIQLIIIDNSDTDTRGFLSDKLLSGKAITNTAVTRPMYQAVLRRIAAEKDSIGFARASDIFRLRRTNGKGTIKVLGLRIREGTQVFFPVTTIAGGHSSTYYPLERPYFLYNNAKAPEKLAEVFASYCEQKIVTNPGDYLDERF